jgi:hypothetical protein
LEGVYWIHVAQYRDQWQTCEHCKETSGSVKGGESLD